jgi:hypothetical protein
MCQCRCRCRCHYRFPNGDAATFASVVAAATSAGQAMADARRAKSRREHELRLLEIGRLLDELRERQKSQEEPDV